MSAIPILFRSSIGTERRQSVWSGVLVLVLMVLLPGKAFATHFEISRLAAELEYGSLQFSQQLRPLHGYGTVRSKAERLSRESADLVELIARNRSNSRIRSQFNEVGRRYNDLEAAFLRVNRNRRSDIAYNQMGFLSDLFGNLNSEYYYASYSRPVYRGNSIFNTLFHDGHVDTAYSHGARHTSNGVSYYGKSYSSHGSDAEGNNSRSRSYSSSGNNPIETGNSARSFSTRNFSTSTTTRYRGVDNYDHSSPVLERQYRNDRRHDQSQHGHDRRRNQGVETRRRNHYE